MPVYIVPSSMPALHDGTARVAARISETTSAFSGSKNDAPPVFVVAGGGDCGCPVMLLSPSSARGGPSRLKEHETGSYTPSDSIQSCQRISLGIGWIDRFERIESADAHLVDDE